MEKARQARAAGHMRESVDKCVLPVGWVAPLPRPGTASRRLDVGTSRLARSKCAIAPALVAVLAAEAEHMSRRGPGKCR